MPHRSRERFAIGQPTSRTPLGFGEPRFRPGRGASLQPTDFALALADFQSGIAPRRRRAARQAFEDELEIALGVAKKATPRRTTARLLRRKLSSFGSVLGTGGISVQPTLLERQLLAGVSTGLSVLP